MEKGEKAYPKRDGDIKHVVADTPFRNVAAEGKEQIDGPKGLHNDPPNSRHTCNKATFHHDCDKSDEENRIAEPEKVLRAIHC